MQFCPALWHSPPFATLAVRGAADTSEGRFTLFSPTLPGDDPVACAAALKGAAGDGTAGITDEGRFTGISGRSDAPPWLTLPRTFSQSTGWIPPPAAAALIN